MLPLLRFASGIVVGAITVQLLKQSKAPDAIKSMAQKARSGLDKAGDELRDATISGLSAVEKSSANLRAKLSGESETPPAESTTADAAAPPEQTPASSETPKNEKT